TAEDWLEHDGYVSEAQPATWSDLRAAVATEEAFRDASPCDTYVRRAWLGDHSFYLRWHYYDDADTPPAGDGDITADPAFVGDAVRELAALGIEATTDGAAAFFQQRWNGRPRD